MPQAAATLRSSHTNPKQIQQPDIDRLQSLQNMSKEFTQDEINSIVWKACDSFRGAVDPSEYKNYILTMLFLKYLTDLWKDKRDELSLIHI